jgi:hypothetical protein
LAPAVLGHVSHVVNKVTFHNRCSTIVCKGGHKMRDRCSMEIGKVWYCKPRRRGNKWKGEWMKVSPGSYTTMLTADYEPSIVTQYSNY